MSEPSVTREDVEKAVEAARQEVYRLARGGRWQMTIPVDERRDSDTIICHALRLQADRLATLERERDALRFERHECLCGHRQDEHLTREESSSKETLCKYSTCDCVGFNERPASSEPPHPVAR